MKHPAARRSSTAGVLLLVAPLAACGQGDPVGDEGGSGTTESTTLTVFAAASLAGAFEELGQQFETAHDGVEVEFSFAGSSALVAQIQQGAPADVFASADETNMGKLTAEDLVAEPRTFATNTLQIAVPSENPAGVQTLQDLTERGLNLVVCAPEVPCGGAAQRVAEIAGLAWEPVSEEQSVTGVLNKVQTGEADAGLVYVTDVAAAGDAVQGITFPEAADVVNAYPIAPIADSDETALAAGFVDLVVGQDGQAVLQDFGFGRP
jgi:molybdate transport system substrate-binding protein